MTRPMPLHWSRMFTEVQRQYMEEVLGVAPPPYVEAEPPNQDQSIVVLRDWTEPELQLLKKILASVQLTLETQSDRHRLDFCGGVSGRFEVDGYIHWRLPTLEEMLGPQAQEKKKEAWQLLQEFTREYRAS